MMGYCPYCGRMIGIYSMFYNNQAERYTRITWERCRTPRCDGGFENIVTDVDLFVRSPYKVRGKYIGRIPNDNKR